MQRKYYRKPTPVEAFQWPQHKDELCDRLSHMMQVQRWQYQSPAYEHSYRIPTPGCLEIDMVGQTHLSTFVLGHTDWLVIEGGKISIYSDKIFKEKFFHVDVQPAVVVAPNLEDLL